MAYYLGTKSRQNLQGVHPKLVDVVERAIKHTSQDFSVLEGVRTIERQRELVRRGASQTMNSKHLVQPDGYAHAVDLVPYPLSWDWEQFYPIADAMILAAKELDVHLRWGGNWRVYDVRKWYGTAKLLNRKYPGRFPDGPHFEIRDTV